MIYRRTVQGEQITLNHLPWYEDAAKFERWVTHVVEKEGGVAGFDVETTAIDEELGAFEPGMAMRLIQFGSLRYGWALDPHDEFWRPRVEKLLLDERLRFVSHTNYDPLWSSREFGIDLGERSIDTMPMACLLYPGNVPKDLKNLVAHLIDDQLIEAEAALLAHFRDLAHADPATKGNRTPTKLKTWGFTTIPIDDEMYGIYGALDAVCVRRLLAILDALLRKTKMAALSRREQRIARLATAMRQRGMRVDAEWSATLTKEFEANYGEAEDRLWAVLGFTPGSPDLGDWLAERGVEFTEFTPTGRAKITMPSASSEGTLPGLVARYGAVDVVGPVLRDKMTMAEHKNILTNLRIINRAAANDGYVHPEIRTQAAVTGRMCLPDDHQLLTRRGVLPIEEVCIGDETLDASGRWVPVQAIHHYQDQEVIVREHRHGKIESTTEHRWLVSSSEHPEPWLEPLNGARRKIHLTPEQSFDFADLRMRWYDERTRFATLVGLLVSDGRCHSDGDEMRAWIYQDERKFYREILAMIPPEAISYDRLTTATHHEIRLRTRWLRPRLEAAGLAADPLLRTSESLWRWVLTLSVDELRAFLSAVWLADGSTAHPQNKKICAESEPLRRALQYAGYRLGCQSRMSNDGMGGWSTKDRLGVKFITAPIWTRHLTETTRQSDVWCVTTESGTFTAWSDRPYLTGNSVVKPAMQTFKKRDPRLRGCFIARDGCVLVGADYASAQVRIAAALSRDKLLLRVVRDGLNQHAETAKAIFGPRYVDKTTVYNPISGQTFYDVSKTLDFAQMFGAGPRTIGDNLGMPRSTQRDDRGNPYANPKAKELWEAWRRSYSGLVEWSAKIGELRTIVNPWRRRIPADPWRGYASGNYLIQSTERDMLGDALIRLMDAGWGESLWLPVHDEIILEVREDEAADACKALETCMYTVINGIEMTATAAVIGRRWGADKDDE